jgi:hypothetical protein
MVSGVVPFLAASLFIVRLIGLSDAVLESPPSDCLLGAAIH